MADVNILGTKTTSKGGVRSFMGKGLKTLAVLCSLYLCLLVGFAVQGLQTSNATVKSTPTPYWIKCVNQSDTVANGPLRIRVTKLICLEPVYERPLQRPSERLPVGLPEQEHWWIYEVWRGGKISLHDHGGAMRLTCPVDSGKGQLPIPMGDCANVTRCLARNGGLGLQVQDHADLAQDNEPGHGLLVSRSV